MVCFDCQNNQRVFYFKLWRFYIMKKTMLTGVRPSGNLTLGNYLGAIKNFVDRQEQYNSYIFLADLHAITT